MVWTSRKLGTLRNTWSPSASKAAVMIGRAAFLAPLMGTVPTSLLPPMISSESTPPCYRVATVGATSGERQPENKPEKAC